MKTTSTFLNDNIKPILALVIVILGFSYFFMCSIRNIKPDPQILIAFVAAISGATGYYFGSSQGSSKKDYTIADTIASPVVTNADTVNVK
jgi:hypothetical protein